MKTVTEWGFAGDGRFGFGVWKSSVDKWWRGRILLWDWVVEKWEGDFWRVAGRNKGVNLMALCWHFLGDFFKNYFLDKILWLKKHF